MKQKKQVFLRYAKSCKEVFMDDDQLDNEYNKVRNKYASKKVMFVNVWKE
jgi:hypothetical protein